MIQHALDGFCFIKLPMFTGPRQVMDFILKVLAGVFQSSEDRLIGKVLASCLYCLTKAVMLVISTCYTK